MARTLRYIEGFCIQTRRNQRRENTGAMVGATFRHETSRNHDPQLHTHAVTAVRTLFGVSAETVILISSFRKKPICENGFSL